MIDMEATPKLPLFFHSDPVVTPRPGSVLGSRWIRPIRPPSWNAPRQHLQSQWMEWWTGSQMLVLWLCKLCNSCVLYQLYYHMMLWGWFLSVSEFSWLYCGSFPQGPGRSCREGHANCPEANKYGGGTKTPGHWMGCQAPALNKKLLKLCSRLFKIMVYPCIPADFTHILNPWQLEIRLCSLQGSPRKCQDPQGVLAKNGQFSWLPCAPCALHFTSCAPLGWIQAIAGVQPVIVRLAGARVVEHQSLQFPLLSRSTNRKGWTGFCSDSIPKSEKEIWTRCPYIWRSLYKGSIHGKHIDIKFGSLCITLFGCFPNFHRFDHERYIIFKFLTWRWFKASHKVGSFSWHPQTLGAQQLGACVWTCLFRVMNIDKKWWELVSNGIIMY